MARRFLEELADPMIIILLAAAAISGVLAVATSKVLRNGKITAVHSEELVVGDIIILEAGDAVPADGRVLESASMKMEEAALTGESLPVEKFTDRLHLNDGGKIADALAQTEEGKKPLQIKLGQFSKILTWLVLGICAIVLSIGVTNMSKRNATIRKLTAVETLGCAQIICSDKNGTLTQNKMTVVDFFGEDEKRTASRRLLSEWKRENQGLCTVNPVMQRQVFLRMAWGLMSMFWQSSFAFASFRSWN